MATNLPGHNHTQYLDAAIFSTLKRWLAHHNAHTLPALVCLRVVVVSLIASFFFLTSHTAHTVSCLCMRVLQNQIDGIADAFCLWGLHAPDIVLVNEILPMRQILTFL